MRVTDRCKDLHNCQARHVLLDEVHVSNVLANELSGSGFASLVETSIIVTAWITSDEVFGRRGLPTDTVKGVVNQREGKARAQLLHYGICRAGGPRGRATEKRSIIVSG